MRVFVLIGKKKETWNSIKVSENYSDVKDEFVSLMKDNQGYEKVMMLDEGGLIRRKTFAVELREEAPEAVKVEHRKKKHGAAA